MGKNNAPPFRETGPRLALAASCDLAIDFPLKDHRNAGEVRAERNNIQPLDGSRQVSWGARFAKGLNLVDAIQTLSRAKAYDVGRGPEHVQQGLHIVRDQGLLVAGIELAQLGDGVGIVDRQEVKTSTSWAARIWAWRRSP